MNKPNELWADQLHCMLRDMLVAQNNFIGRMNPAFARERFPWHRVVYIKAGEMMTCTGALLWLEKPVYDITTAQKKLLDIWGAGLSWALLCFDKPADSETLVEAVARRIRNAQARFCHGEKSTDFVDEGVDNLVECAGRGLFSFEYFFRIAYSLDFADIGQIHEAFMAKVVTD